MAELVNMTEEDIERCRDIYFGAFDTPQMLRELYLLNDYFQAYINDETKYALVLKAEGIVVGFVTAAQTPDVMKGYNIHIDVFAIAPEFQRQGFGHEMLTRFMQDISKDNYVSLETHKRKPSYKLYTDCGFIDDDDVRYLFFSPLHKKLVESLKDAAKLNEDLTKEYEQLIQQKKLLEKE